MSYVLGLMIFFGSFYVLGKFEQHRRARYFGNVLKVFKMEKVISINEKTNLRLYEEKTHTPFSTYIISVEFDGIIVEERSYTERLNRDEPIAFRGPWKKDIYKVLRDKHLFYWQGERPDNVVKLKSRRQIYAERYKRYVNSRERALN